MQKNALISVSVGKKAVLILRRTESGAFLPRVQPKQVRIRKTAMVPKLKIIQERVQIELQ